MTNNNTTGIVWLTLCNILWGGAFIAWYQTYEFSVVDALATRILIVGILGVLWVAVTHTWADIKGSFNGTNITLALALMALLGAHWYAFTQSAQEGLAFETAFAYFTVWILISAISHITEFHSPSLPQYLCYGLCGVALLQFYSAGGMGSTQYAFLIMVSTVVYTIIKNAFKTNVSPLLAVTWEVTLLVPVALLWFMKDSTLDITLIEQESLIWLAFACVVFSFVPLLLFFKGQKTAPIYWEKMTHIIYPVTVLMVAWFYLEQAISYDMMLALMLIGVANIIYIWQETNIFKEHSKEQSKTNM